ncbi:hypothetical protein EUTSA_v10028332mg [Eutrema salsugineum]|uniref:F-box domain-containing protein n=1 Tax=Eutrema salsugineum TaxID=72664 RepID=V4L9V7_EUTSA|nr:hypothetical protein EUTSA_v10028332mg [Eutrema salsugineum]
MAIDLELPNDLLVKILSFLPTKVAVSTRILSKQWEYYSESEYKRLKCFLDRNLPLHRAQVIESFRLGFYYPHFEPGDIRLWVLTVVSRYIRELDIFYVNYKNKQDILPSNLYTCKTLVTLKLRRRILVDVPRVVCLPCLKTLHLQDVRYSSEDSLQRLLSNCSVLEDLLVKGCEDDNMRKFIVIVPSLKRLKLDTLYDLEEIVIHTPCLEYLKLDYYSCKSHHYLIENMPKLREASLDVISPVLERLIGSITSVKRLTLCTEDYCLEGMYNGDDFVFNQLEHLKVCKWDAYALNMLVRFLKYSPKLRVLDFVEMDEHGQSDVIFWNQPSTVPECMLSSLQAFKFSGYLGRPEERDLAIYILKNARCLKTATILSKDHLFEKNPNMIQELALSPRASTECQLVFDDLLSTSKLCVKTLVG